MIKSKLGTCLLAAAITVAGATHLAQPAEAAEVLKVCSAAQQAYAQGYMDGQCGGQGMGVVTNCTDDGGGNFSWDGGCR
jgi:hypothetical protein